jgi:pSer/pThr/pTyr-binding forkhead associated (FHA) protein
MTSATGPALLLASGYSGVIRLVQWCVVALILLFFLRVIRAVFVEVRPVGPRLTRRDRRRARRDERRAARDNGGQGPGQLQLEVVEPADREGQRFEINGGITVGRGSDCDISTSYDSYSSGRHAQLFYDGKRLMVEDLGSTNGTFVNAERISKATRLGRGDMVQVGGTVFEVVR